MPSSPRRILGIDPGYGRMGWAVIGVVRGTTKRIASGCFITPAKESPANRLLEIYDELRKVIKTHTPTECAMEHLYFQRNVSTAIGVGQARGVVLLALAQRGLLVREFSPSDVKLATTGYGRADKRQMGLMIMALLKLPAVPKYDDEADALAIALCAAAHRHIYAT